jgi:hypothetical protein
MVQEQEMMKVYMDLDEEWLDAALRGFGEGRAPPLPTDDEDVILKARQNLGHAIRANTTANTGLWEGSQPRSLPNAQKPRPQ